MSGKQVQMKIKMWHFGDQALHSAPGYKDERREVGETTSLVQREPRIREPSLEEDQEIERNSHPPPVGQSTRLSWLGLRREIEKTTNRTKFAVVPLKMNTP